MGARIVIPVELVSDGNLEQVAHQITEITKTTCAPIFELPSTKSKMVIIPVMPHCLQRRVLGLVELYTAPQYRVLHPSYSN